MMNETETPSPTVTPQRLAKFISAYFSEPELRDLCFELNVDYEDLPLGGKSEKARELVTYMDRRKRLPELTALVRQLRPHLGMNLNRLTQEILPQNDPRLQGVASLLEQFRQYYRRLREWKELHNHLDETLNVFGQYAAQVERFAVAGVDVDPVALDISWQPVHRRMSVMLAWAERDIEHIGRPYRLLENGEREGEKWAVELAELHQALHEHLKESPGQRNPANERRAGWRRFFNAQAGATEARSWEDWQRHLRELTRTCDNALKTHMFLADKELRKTALELYEMSREALWS